MFAHFFCGKRLFAFFKQKKSRENLFWSSGSFLLHMPQILKKIVHKQKMIGVHLIFSVKKLACEIIFKHIFYNGNVKLELRSKPTQYSSYFFPVKLLIVLDVLCKVCDGYGPR